MFIEKTFHFFFYYLFLILNIRINCQDCTTSMFQEKNLRAIAIMKGSLDGSLIIGTITFEISNMSDYVIIKCNITGLINGKGIILHGLHIHSYGISENSDDESVRCGSAGSHFNPTNKNHGDIYAPHRHVGDLGNVMSDNNGNILSTFRDDVIKLYGPFSIIGRTIVLHQLQDDLGLEKGDSSITGNSGNRIACGLIGFY